MRTLNELIQELDAIPGKLAAARQALSEAGRTLKGQKEQVDEFEADGLAAVSAELDERNKPRYTNKESREAAARKALMERDDYRLALTLVASCEVAKQNAEIAVGQLEDTQRSLYVQLEVTLAESRGETIRELTRSVLELARLEAQRLAQKESAHG